MKIQTILLNKKNNIKEIIENNIFCNTITGGILHLMYRGSTVASFYIENYKYELLYIEEGYDVASIRIDNVEIEQIINNEKEEWVQALEY